MSDKGKAELKFDVYGVTNEEAHRFRESLDAIISQGVLALHDGKAILSFDFEGRLREIRFEFNKWRKKSDKSA